MESSESNGGLQYNCTLDEDIDVVAQGFTKRGIGAFGGRDKACFPSLHACLCLSTTGSNNFMFHQLAHL